MSHPSIQSTLFASASAANSPTSGTTVDMSATESLAGQLTSESVKEQLSAISALLGQGDSGALALVNFLRSHAPQSLDHPLAVALGATYQALLKHDSAVVQSFLSTELSQGPFLLRPNGPVDYRELQQRLAYGDYETADRLTLQKLCELAGPDALARKWLYFTEVDRIPAADLRTIDRLWRVYSQDRFGFSRQREIWLGSNQSWDRLWDKLGWKTGNVWTRYPGEFVWSVAAPVGHLPLSNQLRGVRTIASLFAHPAWLDPC